MSGAYRLQDIAFDNDNNYSLNKVIRIEDAPNCLFEIFEELRISFDIDELQNFKNIGKTKGIPHYSEIFDYESRKFIEKRYALDIDIGKYRFEE